jgi:hypothetical protein
VIGTVEQLPTRDLAEVAVNGLRVCTNQHRNRQREQSIVVADLVDHYIQTELSDEADWHSHATRIVYSEFLKRWIRPHWETIAITPVWTGQTGSHEIASGRIEEMERRCTCGIAGGWAIFSIHPSESMGYCGRYVCRLDSKAKSIFVQ